MGLPFLLLIMILLLILDAARRRRKDHDHDQEGRDDSDFASLAASPYGERVLELEVYAAGVRDLNKILELDIEVEAKAS